MNGFSTPQSPENAPDVYEILVEGALDENWSDWLDGVSLTSLENGQTLLSATVPDQAALHGLLARIRDLNLKLISVRQSERPVSIRGSSHQGAK